MEITTGKIDASQMIVAHGQFDAWFACDNCRTKKLVLWNLQKVVGKKKFCGKCFDKLFND